MSTHTSVFPLSHADQVFYPPPQQNLSLHIKNEKLHSKQTIYSDTNFCHEAKLKWVVDIIWLLVCVTLNLFINSQLGHF